MNADPVILASASPRRQELLRRLEIRFQVIPSDAPELSHDQLTARELVQVNAFKKARAIAERFPEALVIGADTLVSLGCSILSKPDDLREAEEMLGRLQGKTHQVLTGVCLLHVAGRRQTVFAEMTDVTFKPLSSGEIQDYLAAVNPLDKAGGYAIQERGECLVSQISGSYSNVVGLPLERLQAELEGWGVHAGKP